MVVRKPVEKEQAFVPSKILYKLDLNSIYPEKSSVKGFNVSVVRASSTPNFKREFNFVIEDKSVFFVTSLDRPAILKVNVYLNSTLKPTETRKFSKVFDVKLPQAPKTNVFMFKSTSPLEDILKSEKEILESFESKLWKSGKPCKNCLGIAYIQPNVQNEYEIGVASTQAHSDLLDEFCFLGEIPEEHLNITNLAVNRHDARCETFARTSTQPIEYYTVNAFLTVDTKEMIHTQFIPGFIKRSIINLYRFFG